uniref:Sulfotransferase domain-containing protein n=1 Tax=Musca domestica TaxID=7370 RepID=A0A1I8NJC0_MUSDO
MIEPVEVKPKRYPTNFFAQEYWDKRRCYVRGSFQKQLDLVHNAEVFEDDVWVVTLPKCGTTWMQELAWLVMHDYDFETAKNVDLELRSPFIDSSRLGEIVEANRKLKTSTFNKISSCLTTVAVTDMGKETE